MAASDAFLSVCRTKTDALAELTTFRTAGALACGSRNERSAQWNRLFATPGADGMTAASRLHKAIRDTVNAQADLYVATSVISAADRELATATLAAEYIPAIAKPMSTTDELALLNAAIAEDQLR